MTTLMVVVLVVLACLLLVWFTADILVVMDIFSASLDVYSLLSFEFQAIDIVEKKIKQSDSVHMNRLLKSLSLRIVRLKNGWNNDECFCVMVHSIVVFLEHRKMAELLEFPFADDEESLRHPIMRELDEDDLERYRQDRRDIQTLAKSIDSIGDNMSSEIRESHPDLVDKLNKLKEQAQEASQPIVLCVRKLPFKGRPKRKGVSIVMPSQGIRV